MGWFLSIGNLLISLMILSFYWLFSLGNLLITIKELTVTLYVFVWACNIVDDVCCARGAAGGGEWRDVQPAVSPTTFTFLSQLVSPVRLRHFVFRLHLLSSTTIHEHFIMLFTFNYSLLYQFEIPIRSFRTLSAYFSGGYSRKSWRFT